MRGVRESDPATYIILFAKVELFTFLIFFKKTSAKQNCPYYMKIFFNKVSSFSITSGNFSLRVFLNTVANVYG